MQQSEGKRALACAFGAVVLMGLYGWIQNSVLFPRFAEFFPVGRELDTAVRALLYVGVALVASNRPGILDAKTIAATSVIATASSTALIYASVVLQSAIMSTAGIVFFEIGHIWIVVFYGLAICLLPTPRHTAIAAAFGIAASNLLEQAMGVLPLEAGMTAMAALPLAALALSWMSASQYLARMQHASTPSDLEIAHPSAFLKPTHALFACILVFSIASGYALTLNEVDNAPNRSPLEWAVLFAVAVAIVLARKPGGEDALFSFSALLAIAGFLAAPFTFDSNAPHGKRPVAHRKKLLRHPFMDDRSRHWQAKPLRPTRRAWHRKRRARPRNHRGSDSRTYGKRFRFPRRTGGALHNRLRTVRVHSVSLARVSKVQLRRDHKRRRKPRNHHAA